MAKKKKARRASRRREARTPVRVLKYEITTEPIEEPRYKRLPDEVKEQIERLHFEAQKRPRQAIPELLDLIERYPDIPALYNFLNVAYANSGQMEKAKEAIRENYERNPDYLFARLNYAELYRSQGEYEKIAEIFEHKFDLKLLYPQREALPHLGGGKLYGANRPLLLRDG